MRFNKKSYKSFTHEEAVKWGKQNYSNWLTELQNPDYSPQIPLEQFFRFYTQGIHHVFNNVLRYCGVEKYDFEDSCISKSMIVDSIDEINKHKLCEDVIVYRYVSKDILRDMKKWSNVRLIRRNSMLTDKGYFSTTLSLESVRTRHYATLRDNSLFTIYVPKGCGSDI